MGVDPATLKLEPGWSKPIWCHLCGTQALRQRARDLLGVLEATKERSCAASSVDGTAARVNPRVAYRRASGPKAAK